MDRMSTPTGNAPQAQESEEHQSESINYLFLSRLMLNISMEIKEFVLFGNCCSYYLCSDGILINHCEDV